MHNGYRWLPWLFHNNQLPSLSANFDQPKEFEQGVVARGPNHLMFMVQVESQPPIHYKPTEKRHLPSEG